MITGARIAKFAGIIVLFLGILSPASAVTGQKKSKKPPPPPLPSGPTGPIPQIPLDSMAPVAPQVNYQNGQLTIMAPNSTLGDILRGVRKQTGAEIDVPDAKERVVTHLGPGPAREVIAELLNGSRFNYVLLGSPTDPTVLTRIVLVAKTGVETASPANPPGQQAILRQQGGAINPTPEQDIAADTNDADVPDENQPPEESVEQPAAETDQPVGQPDQPGVKTPQQLLQEMQQRQLQMQQQQQQQQSGQPPVPQGQPPQPPPQNQR